MKHLIFFLIVILPVTAQFNRSVVDLHNAADQGDLKSVRLLLENGEDPNLLNSEHLTPLHLASRNGHVGVALVLLEHGADPNTQTCLLYTSPSPRDS